MLLLAYQRWAMIVGSKTERSLRTTIFIMMVVMWLIALLLSSLINFIPQFPPADTGAHFFSVNPHNTVVLALGLAIVCSMAVATCVFCKISILK